MTKQIERNTNMTKTHQKSLDVIESMKCAYRRSDGICGALIGEDRNSPSGYCHLEGRDWCHWASPIPYGPQDSEAAFVKPEPPPSEVGSTMEQYREQGYETMVVNGLIDPAKNWGVAVADRDYREDESLR